MLRATQRFFDLSEEEKKEYAGEKVLDPIRYGTSFNVMVDKSLFWRDFLKCHVHPHLNVPSKPPGFRYTKQILHFLHFFFSSKFEQIFPIKKKWIQANSRSKIVRFPRKKMSQKLFSKITLGLQEKMSEFFCSINYFMSLR